MDGYRSASWKQFRAEVLLLDEFACKQCRRSEGVRLHVHHKRYIPGRKPWEYPHHMCETLCSGCHAAEHGIIPPKSGWTFIGHEDLGGLYGECEYCGTEIRHSFLVEHEKWGAMEVGEQCCDELTSTRLATGHLASVRRHLDRRKRFVSSVRWIRKRPGVQAIKQDGIRVELVTFKGAYRLRVRGQLGKREYPTEIEAKAGTFDLIESGVLRKWVNLKRESERRQ